MLRKVFAHPFPEGLDRIKIRAVTRKWLEDKAQGGRCCLNDLSPMTRGTIPNNHDRAVDLAKPIGQMVQKFDGILTIAIAFIPDETLTLGEIVSTIPIDPIL